MKTIVTTKKQAPSRPLSRADLAILLSVERFHYLTASQVSRLLYPNSHDHNRYARRRLAWLAQHEYLLRLTGLPTPWSGSAPHVFTLGREGRALLAATQTYYRPAEEQDKVRNAWFMTHTLATIDVLIAAERLGRSHPVTMPRLLTERQLRVSPLRVSLPAGGDGQVRSVAVVPDAWFELSINGRKPVGIALELDRSTEDQKRWRGKIAALSAWATGPYREAFANPSLTIAVVTPEADRRDTLRSWTHQELQRLSRPQLTEIFLFTDANPVATPPEAFFFGRVWYEPDAAEPVSLLTPQPPAANVIPLPGKEVWQEGG